MVGFQAVYELWVGDDMVDDQLSWEQARKMAAEEMKRLEQEYTPEERKDISVVIDEHRYYHIKTLENINDIEDGKVYNEDK